MKQKVLWGNPFKKYSNDAELELKFLSTVPIFDTLSARQLKKMKNDPKARQMLKLAKEAERLMQKVNR